MLREAKKKAEQLGDDEMLVDIIAMAENVENLLKEVDSAVRYYKEDSESVNKTIETPNTNGNHL